jgi:hypothetical protein
MLKIIDSIAAYGFAVFGFSVYLRRMHRHWMR